LVLTLLVVPVHSQHAHAATGRSNPDAKERAKRRRKRTTETRKKN
jgi:hypothetical protein